MMRVTFQDKVYEFELKSVMESLTGHESIMCEDYLGGWARFRDPANMTRSTIVILWLAKRSAGETVTFDEIAAIPGLVFGEAWTIEDEDDLVGQSPPESTPLTTTAPPPSSPDVSPSPVLRNVNEPESSSATG